MRQEHHLERDKIDSRKNGNEEPTLLAELKTHLSKGIAEKTAGQSKSINLVSLFGREEPARNLDLEKELQSKYDEVIDGVHCRSVKLNGKWGVVDDNGTEIVPLKYDYIYGTRGYIRLQLANKYGVADSSGKELIPVKYEMIVHDGDYFLVRLNQKWGALNWKGEEIFPPMYDRLWRDAGVFFVRLAGKFGLLDYTGKQILPPIYDEIETSYDAYKAGVFYVKLNDKWGVFSKRGEEVLPLKYSSSQAFDSYSVKREIKHVMSRLVKLGTEG